MYLLISNLHIRLIFKCEACAALTDCVGTQDGSVFL